MTDESKPETPGLAEVSAKFVDEAEAVVGDETATEDAVVVLRQRWESVRAERAQLKDRDDKNPKHPDVIEDKRLHDVELDIEELIADTPTHTAAGVAVKLQQLQRDDEGFDGMSSWRPVAFRTALEALGQGIMPAIEDPVIALKREWDARWKRYANETDNSDEVTDPLHERLNETAYQIFQTPATTLAGIAFKLVIWARYHLDRDREGTDDWSRPPVTAYRSLDLDHLPVVSALHDLERMAGGSTVITVTHSPVDLRNQWDRLRLDLEDLNRKHGQLSNSEYADRFDNIVQALGGVEEAIERAPANDWQTLLVKLHIAVGLAQDQVGKLDQDSHPFVELLRTTIRDLERLAGEVRS